MTDPAAPPAAEAARRIRDGRLSAIALTEALLARIAAREPVVRAFIHLDPALALRQAAAVDAAVKAGRRLPLAGLGFGVKDVLDTADQPSQYGSAIWAGHRPRSDAACVALARRAGGIILGKTVTTEFATRHPGATTNPHNPAHTPGGSSSGSAAGAGAGFFHAGFGTQTAGSIIRPAAFCGAVGFKPSWGTLHRAGMKVMSESLDTIGVITGSVADAASVMTGLTGGDYGDPEAKPARAPKLGLCWGPTADRAAPETRALIERVATAAAKAGATVTALEMPPAVAAGLEAHPLVMNGESAEALAWELDHAAAQLSPGLRERMEWGRDQPRAVLEAARAAFATARAAFAEVIAPFDAILTPSAPGEAPEGIGATGEPAFNSLWTLLHVPCVTVPVGTGPKGLPLGAQIVTAFRRDREALAWGEWVRQAAG
ncbi:amidase [Siccirubricoccus deserti]|uniref:Amidase n=1 Tax=Siccirubricoccus deserti TaxID=2013562 RepID=A0A9X0R2W2_9PROT|nr:amidase [Siccirubricoccus deserti]MBC4018469.1 amidase [Siccirubricoccus deserti]GGC65921.1 amidase [Siccirubricoccus deserti]